MPVFISHRTADNVIAKTVYDRLTHTHGIVCYLDDLDKEAPYSNRITALIVDRLTSCTNLLALITRNTKGSWWVPFEVGVARQAPRIITSYTDLPRVELPEFLTEWPVLYGVGAVDTFAEHYKRQVVNLRRNLVEQQGLTSERVASVSRFHRELKTALRQ